ncbi:hypothetical protein ACLB2K_040752 [Fragaria x ananassa]
MNYSDLIQSIRKRFKFSSNDSFHLEYSSPTCSSVYLDNEYDFKMLFCCAKIYHMDNVVVTVVKDVGKSCSSTSVVVDDCAEMIDENDYLDFRDKLRKFAIQSGFHYVLSRNDSIYVNAVCANRDVDHCGWEVLVSVASINQYFYITRFNNVHTCRGMIRNRSHRQLGSKIVRTCIESTVCLNLGLKPREIMRNFKSIYGYEISYKVASRAQKKGFKFSLPVLYVDGAFGKSKYKGQILAATGRNGNKGFFPLALCFCDSETEENWLFFFKNLKALLEPQGRIITFISDRGVGLLKAFDLIFPGNPHLYCYHHLRYNLSRKYKNKGGEIVVADVLQKFFKVAYASTEKSFYFHLKNLRDEGGAATIDEFIREIPLEHWCRAFFKGCRYGIMANGIAESFNNWIVVERSLPPFAMLDQTRMKEMKMMSERSVESKS